MRLVFAIIIISSSKSWYILFLHSKRISKITFSKYKNKFQKIEMVILIYLLHILDIFWIYFVGYWLPRFT